MPISADPNRTVDFWLETDADKPESTRPVFVCRFMTWAEHRKIADLMKRARETRDDEECYRLLVEVIKIGVIGWRNISGQFDPECLPLTPLELWELADGYRYKVRLDEHDLKNFVSPSPSATATADAANNPPASSAETTPS